MLAPDRLFGTKTVQIYAIYQYSSTGLEDKPTWQITLDVPESYEGQNNEKRQQAALKLQQLRVFQPGAYVLVKQTVTTLTEHLD